MGEYKETVLDTLIRRLYDIGMIAAQGKVNEAGVAILMKHAWREYAAAAVRQETENEARQFA